jgi:hypothetical protein
MKKIIYSFILAFLFSNSAFSQMEEGNYTYANKEITLNFTIIEGGFKITDINLTNNSTKKTSSGTGEMMKFQMNVWYQFSTKDCDFEFDVPENKMILSQTCGKAKSKKIELVKKQ